jgi:hypothetical protein
MDGFGAMEWGRATDGGRHLVHTQTQYDDTNSVTAVALCGADLETVVGSRAPWGEYPFLFCAQCDRTWAERTVSAQRPTER